MLIILEIGKKKDEMTPGLLAWETREERILGNRMLSYLFKHYSGCFSRVFWGEINTYIDREA